MNQSRRPQAEPGVELPSGGGLEHRRFARIETSLVCNVATATSGFEAAVVNLSFGGAALLGPDGAAAVDEVVTLLLERAAGEISLALHGRIVRVEERHERILYGVEFESLPPDDEEQLRRLLQLLAGGRGQGRREHPRVAARVEVTCRTEDIFRGWLADLSKGGLSVRCHRPVAPGDAITVGFGLEGLRGLVEVTGEVVSAFPVERGGHRVGVRFTPPGDEERAEVERVLELLLGIALPAGELVEDE